MVSSLELHKFMNWSFLNTLEAVNIRGLLLQFTDFYIKQLCTLRKSLRLMKFAPERDDF